MKLSIGIVGLPNVGKSTLFKLLTKNEVNIANYPFCTIDPNIGVVAVPDARVDTLAKMSKSKKVIPAVVEFYDIAGLVKGAATGEGLGNKFLSHIRDVSAIVEVLRVFGGADIVHVENSVDPIRDMGIINTELVLKDLESVEKRLPRAESDAKGGNASTGSAQAKEAIKEVVVLQQVKELLKQNKSIRQFASESAVKNLALLTTKPKFYLLNGKTTDVTDNLQQTINNEGNGYVVTDLAPSVILSDSEGSNVDSSGLPQNDVQAVIKKAYEILGLISFFTTGEDETRAWTIEKGTLAPQAAGVIHTDFEKKFIRAEVVSYDDFISCNGWGGAKTKGKLRLEGKEYIVKDGDIMEIRHG